MDMKPHQAFPVLADPAPNTPPVSKSILSIIQYWLPLAHRVFNAVAEDPHPHLRVTHGRRVLVVRPAIDWNKGKPVEFLLDSLGWKDCKDVLPIYIGRLQDRRRLVEGAAKRRLGGFGILVSSAPRETSASYSLEDPSEVMEFLKRITSWKRSNDA